MWFDAFSLSRFLSQILHETIKYDIELGVVKCLLKFEHTPTRIATSELILLYQNLGPQTRPLSGTGSHHNHGTFNDRHQIWPRKKIEWNANLAEYCNQDDS
jgi:hypothetical protein